MKFCSVLPAFLACALTGCAIDSTHVPATLPQAGSPITGSVHGGQQAVVGAHVFLYAVGIGGLGTASRSMLTTSGGYVTTGAGGSFNVTGDYTCQSGDQVYLVATGGNPGLAPGTSNSFLELAAALGPCSALTDQTFVQINEVTTAAMVYALAGFASDQADIASQNSGGSLLGVSQAFTTAANLVDVSTGQARTLTHAGNGIVPQALINGLADAIAPCVNSNGNTGSSDPCGMLLAALGVTSIGDTADALLYLSRHPVTPAAAVFGLITPTPPFQPVVTAAPPGWAIAIQYSGGGMHHPSGVAIDASGDIWTTSGIDSLITELANDGTPLSPTTGYTSAAMSSPSRIAIGTFNNVIVANVSAATALSFRTDLLTFQTLSGGGLPTDAYITVDQNGNLWFGSGTSLAKFNGSTLTPLSPAAGYTGHWQDIYSIAADQSSHIWISDYGNSANAATREVNLSGTELSGAAGYFACDFDYLPETIGINNFGNPTQLCHSPSSNESEFNTLYNSGSAHNTTYLPATQGASSMAIDSKGQDWIAAESFAFIYGVSAQGVSLLGSTGLPAPPSSVGRALQVDAAGNIWVCGAGIFNAPAANPLWEYVGLAAPTATPLYRGAVQP